MAYFVWQIDILELSILKRSSEILSRKSRFLGGNAKRNRNFSEFSLDKSKLFNPIDAAALTVACSNYQLRQLRVVMRSLSDDAAVVLVHAFVTSRIDHSCSVLVGLPLGLIGRDR